MVTVCILPAAVRTREREAIRSHDNALDDLVVMRALDLDGLVLCCTRAHLVRRETGAAHVLIVGLARAA